MSEQLLLTQELNEFIQRFEGRNVSSPLRDASINTHADKGRWNLRANAFSGDENTQLCIAAWHALLHWLRYDNDPIITCILNKDRDAVWPLVSEIERGTRLVELHSTICSQWPRYTDSWLALDGIKSTYFADHLLCHAVSLGCAAGNEAQMAEFELIRDDHGWAFSAAKATFSEAYLVRMRDFWLQLVLAMQTTPAALLSDQIFNDSSDDFCSAVNQVSGVALALNGNLVDRFHQQLATHRDALAIIDQTRQVTYAELDALSDQWAKVLVASGVKQGDAVGLVFPRNANMAIAQIAVLKTGAAFVPLDSELPQERLASMCEDAAITLILTEHACVVEIEKKLPKIGCVVSDKLDVKLSIASTKAVKLPTTISQDDAAYIIFTSGSTGVPKGVKVSHGNLLNFVVHFNDANYIREKSVVSQFAPYSFDASVAEIHAALLNAATLVILWKELIDSPLALQTYLTSQQVTFSAFPPQYLQHLAPELLPTLKTLLTAGSAPNYELIKKWLPHVRYINAYGPTETTVLSTAWEADSLPAPDEPISMGAPIANTHVRVVNRFGQSLPEGVTGELIIGGDGVVQGYVNREQLNSEKFFQYNESRWYKSGDLACFNSNRQLIFNGRVDDQIKLRGHRIEPGELESAVLGIDGVDMAAVVVHKAADTIQLVLFLQGEAVDEAAMRDALHTRIPHWAMPNRIVWLAQLPLTSNGKINYKLLREHLTQALEHPLQSVVYENELEQQVAAIWSSVLQRPSISREDNFLFLGGDSLTALVVIAALRNLGYAATSSQLLAQPKLMDFVAHLARGGKTLERGYTPETGTANLTPIQGWFFSQSLAHPHRFCQTLVFETQERLDEQRLHRALERLVIHHDQLRAAFIRADKHHHAGWVQQIASAELEVAAIHCVSLVESDPELLASHTQVCQEQLADELDIGVAPLFRVALIQAAGLSRVVWVLHHLIVDTVSHSLLLNDLYQLYVADSADIAAVLPGKSLSYFAWAKALQEQWDKDPQALLSPWQATLAAAAQAPQLPLAQAQQSTSLITKECRLSADATSRLLTLAPDCYRQSPEELVLAAVYLALGQTFKLPQLGIDIEWHGRDESIAAQGLDRTLGWFTSVHPLYLNLPEEDFTSTPWLGQFLRYLKEARVAVPNRGRDFYGLRFLSDEPEVRAAFADYSGPAVLFNFSGVVQRSTAHWQTLPIAAIEMGAGNQNPYQLSVESEIRDGELVMGLYLDRNIWTARQIDQMRDNLLGFLDAIIDHCCDPLQRRWTPSDFPLLGLGEEEAATLPDRLVAAFPLTDMQQTIYRHRDTYQVWMHYEVARPFHRQHFSEALADWVAHNDCLRTLIHSREDGRCEQWVLANLEPDWSVIAVAEGQRLDAAVILIEQARGKTVEFGKSAPYSLQVVNAGEAAFSVVLSIHHIIHDGWTIELLMDSLWRFYASRLGEQVLLPVPSVSAMEDIYREQQRIAADERWNRYWASVQWAENYCQLPAQSVTQVVPGKVELLLSELSPEITQRLRNRARHMGLTPNSLFIAGFVCLLRYLGGCHQVRLGLIQNGRPETLADVDKITGCCVNTLPLVVDFNKEAKLAGILANVHQQLLTLRDCATYPLSKIHQQAKAQVSGNLFDCLFNIESSAYGHSPLAERPQLKGGYEATNYAFIFGLIEQQAAAADTTYGLRIGFDTSRYTLAQVKRWVGIYEHLLGLLASKTDTAWCDIQPIPEALKEDVAQWNQTAVPYPADVLLGDHFNEVVRRVPDKIAVAFKDVTLTYAELDKQTAALARLLVSKGVGPEVVVGLVAERSLEMVLGIVAVIRAGGAYVPIDPKYPEDRVSHMLEDLNCGLILLQRHEFSRVIPARFNAELINIQEPMRDSSKLPALDTKGQQTRQLAYVMYTSGSTGKPKGVMIEQRSIVRLIKNARDVEFDERDCILITSAPGFDVTTYELWSALLNGLTLAVIDEDTLLNPEQLAAEIQDKQVTFLWVVAPLFNQLVQTKPDLFAGVKRIMIGGDALSPYHINLARQHSPGLAFINGYGPTENTSFSTYHFLNEADTEIIPIGRPITNSTAFVVNPDGHLLPAGVKGELYVGGPGVARGYFKRPELTAEKFVDNGFFKDADKLYRTGDLVSWRDDGLIDFHGRIDFQIKIRGFRVELGEIETAILRLAPVRQALVLALSQGLQKRLVAYLVPDGIDLQNQAQADQLREQVRAALLAELPDYMVPDVFVLLDTMPLSANGKIDRARLPQPDLNNLERTLELPENETEQQLLDVWKEVLGIGELSVTDDFYTIGGDSIVAIQVVARAVKRGLKLSTRNLFEHRNIRALAVVLAKNTAAAPDAPANHAEQEEVVGEQRLLPIQLHFLQSDLVDVHHYNQGGCLALPTANTSLTDLTRMLRALVERHDVMRLKFRQTPAGWLARYSRDLLENPEQLSGLVRELDLRELANDLRDDVLQGALAVLQSTMDLKKGELCRWLCVRDHDGDRLYWVMHHLIVDGISWRVLLADLASAWQQARQGREIVLEHKTSSYQRWAANLYEFAHTETLQAEKAYWLQQLKLPVQSLPLDEDVEDCTEATTHLHTLSFSHEQTRALLQDANRCYQTNINDLLLSALSLSLESWADIQSLRIDLEGHGREPLFDDADTYATDTHATVGWFTSLYPVHLRRIQGDIGQQILAVKAQLAAVPRKGIGFGLLQYLAQDEAILDAVEDQPGSPLVFNYLGQLDAIPAAGAPEFAFTLLETGTVSPRRNRRHTLGINGYVLNGCLQFKIDYNGRQFTHATIVRLAEEFRHALLAIVEHCVGGDTTPPPPSHKSISLSKSQAQELRERYPSVCDLYPATSMQQGLVLYTQRDNASGAYLTQLRMTLVNLDKARFKRVWALLLDKHAILRTAFVDLGLQQLIQVVSDQAELDWRELDCPAGVGESAEAHQLRLNMLLDEERQRPFLVTEAPLMRFLLVQADQEQTLFSWTHHHALLDGWSMGILIQQMADVYQGLATEKLPVITNTPYANYIDWLFERDLDQARHYWKTYLHGVEGSSHLPLAGKHLSADSTSGSQRACTLVLEKELSAQLQTMVRSAGFTLSCLVQSAWALLLSKYTGDNEVLFGYAVSGRPADLPGVEGMVGLFINSLPMRLKLRPEQSLLNCFEQVQRHQVEADEFSFVALADIQKWLGLRTDQPLFESLVVLENYPLDPGKLGSNEPGSLIVRDIQGVEQNDFALNLVVYPGESICTKLVYQSSSYSDETASNLLNQFVELLGGMVVKHAADLADKPLSQLRLLKRADIERAVFAWNDTQVALPNDCYLYDLFEEQVYERPTAIAIVMGDTRLTYRELAFRATDIANWLQNQGVVAGERLAISLPKSPELLACILGALKIGAAYVPIALDCPTDRLTFMLKDAGIRSLVAMSETAFRFDELDVNALYLDCMDADLSADDQDQPDLTAVNEARLQRPAPERLPAYIIYTSGTTGQPKGVMISHENLINFCRSCERDQWIAAGDAVTQFAPFTFDASVGETFAALLIGAELHLLDETLIQDPQAVGQYLVNHNIRFSAFPPPYLEQVPIDLLPANLTLLTAGSAPALEFVKLWGERCRYINAYGPTETTILSSCWHFNEAAILAGKLPIGSPVANTQLYVVDQYGQLCPPGVPGEILIGGAGVALGYLNREEMTAEKFAADPWRPGNRAYRTGDIGIWLDDGTIEFVGRRDHQVKIRGFRIELSGIEYQLRLQPDVEQAVVLVKGEGADKQLLAWVVPKPADAIEDAVEFVARLRTALRAQLADYMVPQGFMLASSLPLTVNGKIDTKALLAADIEPIYEGAYVAPRSGLESTLTEIWARLLDLDATKLSVNANFFDIGGHSLLAMRLVSEIGSVLGLKVAVSDIFKLGTIALLADKLEQRESVLEPIVPVDRSLALPLSFAQQRLWFIDRLEGGSAQYHQPIVLRLTGQLNKLALQETLDALLVRHEVLRTCFITRDGETQQCIATPHSLLIKQTDLSQLSTSQQAVEIAAIAKAEAATLFDLADDLMLRAQLLVLAEQEHILLLTLHHIASDGWSLSVLTQDFAALYNSFVDGRIADLPALPIQYADYAWWQRNQLQGDVLASQREYWLEQLKGLPQVHSLPLDKTRPVAQTYRGAALTRELDGKTTLALRQLAKEQHATLFMVLNAAFTALLHRYSGTADIVMGTTIANREQAEVAGLIGFFVNTLILRNQVDGAMRFTDLLAHCRKCALEAYAHQQMPFDLLVEQLQPERSLSYNPLFQIMLSLENIDSKREVQLRDLCMSVVDSTAEADAQFDLTLDVSESPDALFLRWGYATDLFEADTIERMAGHFEQILAAVLQNAAQPLHKVTRLAEAQRQHLLLDLNDTDQPELMAEPWTERFLAQASQTPEKIAASCDHSQLTYRELEVATRRIALQLNQSDLGRGSLVALMDYRGLDLLVMIIAVLRAGAAYVPIDPTHPIERCLDILHEASPDLLLLGSTLGEQTAELTEGWTDGDILSLQQLNQVDISGCTDLPAVALDDLAYVIYTSGSTGKPKGVMIEHRGMINNMLSKIAPLGLTENDVIAQTASQCFDISVWQFLMAVIVGGRVSIFTDNVVRDPQKLLQQLAAHEVTVWEPVPSVIQAILPVQAALPGMRWVIPTGEALSAQLVQRWFEQYPAIPLMNAYGPAECSDDVAFQPMRGAVERVLIGKPVANAYLHVVDEHLELVPIGVTGELAISGAVVGRGYLNAPELTSAAFRVNPYARHPLDQRLYLTGDLVRRVADGGLEYLGRKDFQVKIRGFRIELEEIEARLLNHPTVESCVVTAFEQHVGNPQLVAYVVAREPVDNETLYRHLRDRLPDYMVPRAMVFLSSLPLTPNGKVNRKALPAPAQDAWQTAPYAAPQTATELVLASIWQDVLQVERVGREDNFFHLGGHSLLIVRVIEALRQQGLNAEVRQVFEAETLAQLAASLTDSVAGDVFTAAPNLIPTACARITPELLPLVELSQAQLDEIAQLIPGGYPNIQDIYPLTPLQEGILFDHILSEAGDTYLASVLLGFGSRELMDTYVSALQKLVDRHDMLRTAILWNGLPRAVQVVQRKARLQVVELVLEAKQDAVEQFERKMTLAGRHIDLTHAPILALFAARDPATGQWLLLQQQHHIVCDQVSMGIEFSDLLAFLRDEGAALPEPVAYREFVAQSLHRARHFNVEAYFRESLAGIDEPTTPFGLLEVYRSDRVTEERVQQLDPTLAKRLREQTQRLGSSPAALFHVAWALVLAKCCNRDDVVFGTVTSGRLQGTQGADKTFGLFINMLPIRLDMTELSVGEALHIARKKLVELLNYEQAPLVETQRCANLPGSTPLFSAVLNFRHEDLAQVDPLRLFPGIEVLKAPGDISNYLFDLSVSDQGEGFELTASIESSIGAERIMGYVCRALRELVDALASAPDTHLLSLPILTEAEEQQLLTTFNQPLRRDLISRTWPELFAAQVLRNPDAIAAECDGRAFTYTELNAFSDCLAQQLRAKGLKRGHIIGLLDYRDLELMVMIIAVLKAGAAYLPLDPTQPTQRWLEILQDAEPDLLIIGNSFVAEEPWLKQQWSLEKVFSFDEMLQELAGEPQTLPAPALNDLAYVLFTSGSTGKPKGVMIEHLGMVNNMLAKVEPLGLTASDVIAQTASQCFDISVWQFLMAPILGGKVVIVKNETTRDPQALLNCLNQHAVTIWEPVPSVIQALLPLAHPLPALRWVLPTGEALLGTLVERWFAQYPQVPLMNAYGPAECSDDVAFQPMDRPVERVFIGKPVANARLHVVDRHLSLLPTGVVGELAVSGPVVGRGYLHRPDLTGDVFKANPYAQDELDTRLYLTGDLAKRHADGNLEYIGRKDFQVKVRGFRIELGEIEVKLSAYPSIKEVVVAAKPNAQGEQYLVAYYTLKANAEPVSRELLMAHLAMQLPDYMVPGVYLALDALPLNNNGKVDRKALPMPDNSALQSMAYTAPEGYVEEKVAAVWQSLLDVERVGREANFFDLGGNSILIIRMLSELKAQGINLRASDVYQQPTLKACCETIAQQTRSLASWLGNGIRHQFTSVKLADRNLTILLLDSRHRALLGDLQQVLADECHENLPDIIRFSDSPEKQVELLRKRGAQSLPGWTKVKAGPFFHG